MARYNIELDNPPDAGYVKSMLITIAIMILFGISISFLFPFHIVPLLGLAGVAFVFLILVIFREYLEGPKRVQIEKEGVRFFFRFWHPRFIEWDEIIRLRWFLSDPNSWSNRDGMGTLRIPNQTIPYCLTPAIAQEVAQAYRENTGREPPGMSLRT